MPLVIKWDFFSFGIDFAIDINIDVDNHDHQVSVTDEKYFLILKDIYIVQIPEYLYFSSLRIFIFAEFENIYIFPIW